MSKFRLVNKVTISNYSKRNAVFYDNAINKNFAYGKITSDFVNKIKLKKKDHVIADIGCGTGFVFDIMYKKIKKEKLKFIGIEPAKGMLKIAKRKYRSDKRFVFLDGSFENVSLKENSVDKVISTLALHWTPSISNSLKEIKRVLKSDGSVDILMIDKNDGKEFKKIIFKTMKKFLSVKQIFKAANLIQRVSSKELKKIIEMHFDLKKEYSLSIKNIKKIIYGSYNEHMHWWHARSLQFISEIKNKDYFMKSLKKEFQKIKTKKGIPFDLSVLCINLKKKIT